MRTDDLSDACSVLGDILHSRSQLEQARKCFPVSLRADPHCARAHSNFSLTLAYLLSVERVLEHSGAALALLADSLGVWNQRLCALTYHPDLKGAQIVSAFVRRRARFLAPTTDFSRHDRTAGLRLRIGCVSPDFQRHTSRFYFTPLLSHHARDNFELVGYSNVKIEDEFTYLLKAACDHWRPIRHSDDAVVTRLVRGDGADVLVDCCNQMEVNRLDIFILALAPIRAMWLGAAWTTDLKTINYMLSDLCMAP